MSIFQYSGEKPAPRKIVAFDLEWYPRTYKFRLGGIYDGDHYQFFDSPAALLQALCCKEYRGAYIYSHFGGAADEQFLLEPWLRGRFKVNGVFSGGSMVFAKVSKGNHRWYFLDSYWTLRRPLADIATSVGMKKGTEEEYKCPGGCSHPASESCVFYAPMSVLKEYNARDCMILYRAMTRFQEEIRELGGELKATAASTALGLFRRVYLENKIRTNEWVNEFSRGAYIASRVEVFKPVCKGPAAFWDVNSMFPWAMIQPFPGNLWRTSKRWNCEELAVVDATVEVPESYVPALGFRGKDGAIYHPTGRWREKFTGVDLNGLEETGGKIIAIHKTLLFESRYELANYVHELYDRRKKETDPFLRDLYKLLMNSLYGKFGEAIAKKSLSIERGKIVTATTEKYVPHRWLPIGAMITSRARQLLGKYLRRAEDIYYTDTDSIVTTTDKLQEGKELGQVKREREIKDQAIFFRPKFYKVDDENVKAKGFSRLNKESFDKLMAGEPVEITRMRRIREKITQMKRDGFIEHDGSVGWFDPLHPCDGSYTKKLSMDLRPKRAPDGVNETRPWTVAELRK